MSVLPATSRRPSGEKAGVPNQPGSRQTDGEPSGGKCSTAVAGHSYSRRPASARPGKSRLCTPASKKSCRPQAGKSPYRGPTPTCGRPCPRPRRRADRRPGKRPATRARRRIGGPRGGQQRPRGKPVSPPGWQRLDVCRPGERPGKQGAVDGPPAQPWLAFPQPRPTGRSRVTGPFERERAAVGAHRHAMRARRGKRMPEELSAGAGVQGAERALFPVHHGEQRFAVRREPGATTLDLAPLFARPRIPQAHGIIPRCRRNGPAVGRNCNKPYDGLMAIGRTELSTSVATSQRCSVLSCPPPRLTKTKKKRKKNASHHRATRPARRKGVGGRRNGARPGRYERRRDRCRPGSLPCCCYSFDWRRRAASRPE